MTVIRSLYSDRYPVVLDFTGEVSLTKQSFSKECDVNFIISKYQKTGLVDHVNRFEGQYGDFLDVQDYQSSLNAIKRAQDEFMSLPSSLRSRFSNDPAQFLSFIQDENNREEAINLGLINRPAPVPESEPEA